MQGSREGVDVGVAALGYVGLDATDVGAWRGFATGVLGLEEASRPEGDDGTAFFRLDDRAHRVAVHPAAEDRLAYIGWEVAGAEALAALAERLEQAGRPVKAGDGELARARGVTDVLVTDDPSGNRLELFWGAELNHAPLRSPAGVSGFVTGDLGLGHVVLLVADFSGTLAFYTDVLDFRLSDWMMLGRAEIRFLHCNARHHSLALVNAGGAPALAHVMTEVASLADVGRALDRCRDGGAPLAKGLGQHTNDHMTSFYARTPGGFEWEYGCGGRRVDDGSWVPTRITATSYWGHRPDA